MTLGWLFALLGAAVVRTAILVHTKVIGFLPEDPPAPRKPKPWPLPMVGWLLGIVALAVVLACNGTLCWVGAGALALAAGTIDDFAKRRGGLAWWIKAVLLLGSSALAAFALDRPAWSAVLFLFVIVNAVNFLDNTDGVALAVAAVPLGVAAAPHGLGCLGALFLGMLPFNWPNSKVILGDGGAYVLGLGLGSAALVQRDLAAGLGLVVVPLLDFLQVVGARLWLGYAPWIADRRHLTHILIHAGLPAAWIAPLFGLLALTCLCILRGFGSLPA